MPAYDYDNWFVIFFAIFIIINLYIFMSIVLATIYYNYKKNLKVEYSKTNPLFTPHYVVMELFMFIIPCEEYSKSFKTHPLPTPHPFPLAILI